MSAPPAAYSPTREGLDGVANSGEGRLESTDGPDAPPPHRPPTWYGGIGGLQSARMRSLNAAAGGTVVVGAHEYIAIGQASLSTISKVIRGQSPSR